MFSHHSMLNFDIPLAARVSMLPRSRRSSPCILSLCKLGWSHLLGYHWGSALEYCTVKNARTSTSLHRMQCINEHCHRCFHLGHIAHVCDRPQVMLPIWCLPRRHLHCLECNMYKLWEWAWGPAHVLRKEIYALRYKAVGVETPTPRTNHGNSSDMYSFFCLLFFFVLCCELNVDRNSVR